MILIGMQKVVKVGCSRNMGDPFIKSLLLDHAIELPWPVPNAPHNAHTHALASR